MFGLVACMRCQLLSNSISPLEDEVEYGLQACSNRIVILSHVTTFTD